MFQTTQRVAAGACVALAFMVALHAQKDRVIRPVDRLQTATVRGNVHPNARPGFDAGPLDPAQQLKGMALVLKPSPEQQAALERLLTEQQDPRSASYHKWLNPQEFADRFGASRGDIANISAWLQSEGFTVDLVAPSRNWIWFSGNAATVQSALHTQIRRYRVDGEMHFANATDPAVPAAIAPMVTGIIGLDDFRPEPTLRTLKPQFTNGDNSHYLAPDDFAAIYNLVSLYNAGYDGAGQSIVIAGQTNIDLSVIQAFRNQFNLPSDAQFGKVLVPASADPGVTKDIDEANLDMMWSGAVARHANIVYVYSTNVLLGSVPYAVTNNIAPVISYSYGLCELAISGVSQSSLEQMAQQAASQGITWVAASGDSGAATCDAHGKNTVTQASHGLAVSYPASVPEVTAVGGTMFAEGNGAYWNAGNAGAGGSATGYIPEAGWNESGNGGLASTGGGESVIFSKPPWQTGTGVPDRNARAVPDIALAAASGHDGYLVVTQDGSLAYTGGTSAAAPAFAGIVAVLNQYTNQAGQGNLNPNLYRLAQSHPEAFNDVTSGSNIVPCVSGSPDCSNGSLGYTAGPGYDLVTGLGSINAYNLVTNWTNQSISTTTTMTANPASFALNGSTQLVATVAAVGSGAAPTGSVAFFATAANSSNPISLGSSNLDGSGKASLNVNGSEFQTAGTYKVTANYGGGPNFNGSSGSTSITVNAPTAASSAIIPSVSPNPVYQQQADAQGYGWFYTVSLSEVAGVGTTLTGLMIDGNDYSSQIATFFGTASIAAHGTVQASLRTKGLTPPATLLFVFSGADASGKQWSQQMSVAFYGPQITAALAMSSAPTAVRQTPGNDPNCQWYQNVGVQELNGHSVSLTRFLAGGNDLSDQIQDFFGSTTVPAFGYLLSGICWSGISPLPSYVDYELDGVDDNGNNISVTMSTLFEGPAANPGSLALSKSAVNMQVADPSQSATTTIGVNVTPGLQWSVSVFPSNQTTRWLVAYPVSGVGPGKVTITASGKGLTPGARAATLVFQAIDANPQFINVPVSFSIAPPPSISALSPPSAVQGSGAFTLSVAGSNFISGSVVEWNGTPLPTTYVNSGELLALVGPNATASTGSGVITVASLGRSSSPVAFPINASYGATFGSQVVTNVPPPATGCSRPPSITSFSQSDGTAFLYFEASVTPNDNIWNEWLGPDGSVIADQSWSAGSGTYCFVGGSLPIPANLNGPWQVRVYDNSDLLFAIPFSIGGPGISSLSPTSASGGGAVQLSVGGAGFDSHAVVQWTEGGRTSNLPTLFQSSVLVQATVPANLLAMPGTAQIAVVNSNGAASNAVTFSVAGGGSANEPASAAAATNPNARNAGFGKGSQAKPESSRKRSTDGRLDVATWSQGR